MSVYSEYAERLSQEYETMRRIDQAPVPWEEGYVPLVARRGPDHARRELDRFHETLTGARKRVREEQIKQLLDAQPTWDLLWRAPLGRPESIHKSIQRAPRVVLLGDAGAGKTTALRSMAVERPALSEVSGPSSERPLVVLIDLPEVPGLGQVSLPEYLAEDAERRLSISASPEFFEETLVRGHAVVCLDGLDEVLGPQERALAVRQIEDWVFQFPNCHYVVAAHRNLYEPALSRSDFTHLLLVPWSETVVEDLDRAWNGALEGWVAEGPDRPYSVQRARFWQHLAWAMRSRNRSSVSLEEAEAWLAEAVQADKMLQVGRRRIPGEVQALLEQSVPQLPYVQVQDGQLSFVHTLMQDILAAHALESLVIDSGVEAAWGEIEGYLDAAAWRQTVALALRFLSGNHPDLCQDLMLRLLAEDAQAPWEPVLHRRLLLVAQALRTASDGLSEDVRRRVVDLLVAWMGDVDAVGREDALYALWQMDGEAYLAEQAIRVAQDEVRDLWSREAALLLLGQLGDLQATEAIDLLTARMEDAGQDTRVRLAAATSLGALGSVPPAARGALAEAERALVVERLLECIQDPEAEIDLRVAVGEALSAIQSVAPDANIVETLEALARAGDAEERPPYSVQVAAADGLASMLADGSGPEFVERMLALARDTEVNDAVRTRLAEALGQLGEAEAAAQILIGIAQEHKVYAPGRRAALDALGRVGYADQGILDQVVQIARTKDRKVKDFVRLAAAHALVGLGHLDLATQHMLMLIADKSLYRSTRNQALAYLGQLGSTGEADLDAAAVAVLQIWANEENTTEDVRENAIAALRTLRAGQDEIVRDLIAIIQNKGTYPRVRRVTAAELGHFPIAQKDMVVEALSPVFYDPEEKSDLLRVPIARLLFLWGEDEHALAYLRLAAEQSYMAQVRYNASMVLLEIGEVGLATAELLRLARNPDISDVIRCDAARALGLWLVGDEDVAPALAGIAQSTELEPSVRGAAYASLRAITA